MQGLNVSMRELEVLVINGLRELLGNRYEFVSESIVKNNDNRLHGICVRHKNQQVAPIFYLESIQHELKRGRSLDSVLGDIVALVRDKSIRELNEVDYSDFDWCKDKIGFRLVNKGLNTEFLKDKVYVEFLDLAIVLHVVVEDSGETLRSYTIKKELASKWDMSAEELLAVAIENSECVAPSKVSSMYNTLLGIVPDEDMDRLSGDIGNGMWIVTNSRGINGAATILYPGILQELAESIGRDLVILPSSVHEVIAIPMEEQINFEYLRSMVHEINRDSVDVEERLSDNVYFYDMETQKLSIAGCD